MITHRPKKKKKKWQVSFYTKKEEEKLFLDKSFFFSSFVEDPQPSHIMITIALGIANKNAPLVMSI